jgi:hypothetical protein
MITTQGLVRQSRKPWGGNARVAVDELTPADGMMAAAENGTSARPRWQLSGKAYINFASTRKGLTQLSQNGHPRFKSERPFVTEKPRRYWLSDQYPSSNRTALVSDTFSNFATIEIAALMQAVAS